MANYQLIALQFKTYPKMQSILLSNRILSWSKYSGQIGPEDSRPLCSEAVEFSFQEFAAFSKYSSAALNQPSMKFVT